MRRIPLRHCSGVGGGMSATTASMADSFNTPVGYTLGIAVNGAGWRIAGRSGDVRQLQRLVIGDSVVSCGVHEPDGIVGRDLVQVGSDDVAALGQLAFIPARRR